MLNFRNFIAETTLETHEVLNPLLWSKGKFDSASRNKLLELAEFWRENALIPRSALKDVLIVGGNANYNYTKYSDLDLHLYVDKSKIPDCDKEILDEYLKSKKSLWTLTHNVKIYGIPVEIYAQGTDEPYGENQGVYSLLKDEWIQKPKREKIDIEDSLVAKKAKYIMNKIDYFIDNRVDKPEIISDFKEKLRRMRKSGIEKGGEFSVENLAFKEVRNKGYLDKMQDYLVSLEDKKFSLTKADKVKNRRRDD